MYWTIFTQFLKSDLGKNILGIAGIILVSIFLFFYIKGLKEDRKECGLQSLWNEAHRDIVRYRQNK